MTDDPLFNPLCEPWTLHFDRDGTEDFGIICDAEGRDIVASHLPSTRLAEKTFVTGTFWLPEPGDPIPQTVRQLRLMTAAPKLLRALDALLRETVDADLKHGISLSEGEQEAWTLALAAIAEATDGPPDDPEPDVHALLAERRRIAAVWGTEDVRAVRPDLTADQAWQVLQAVKRYLDAGVGITWETLETYARDLFGDEPDDEPTPTSDPKGTDQ